ncbi:PTS ascorbate transporter subunit IIC [Lysinibacillus sp. 54212]|uniref:PTS ascorbate transporter subunit IIC n=1 Tax=Lysinibacillus sp. 54212 TaxID=3119829 RepID=UPI002FCB908E
MITDVGNLWDFSFMWQNFEYFAKLSAPFLMIAVAILAVGALLIMIVTAVVVAVKNR